MEDLQDVTPSSETASEYCTLPYPNYEDILVLIEQLTMECKDSGSLLKIQDTARSYKRLIRLKNRHCEALTGKVEQMENKVRGLQKQLSETEHKKGEQERELCALRFALKQEEEKRRNADWLYEKIKEQLREKEEQYNKEVEMKQQLEICVRTLDVELKTVRSNLSQALEEQKDTQRQLSQEQNARILQDKILASHLCKQKEIEKLQEKTHSELQEAQDQHAKAVRHAEKMQDHMQKLKLENCKLKVTERKQAEKIEQLKKNLLNANLNDDFTEKLEAVFSKCFHLDKENQFLQQELLSMKTIQKKCGKLEKHKNKLEQEVANLKSHMEKNMVECGQIEQYKQEIEERAKQDLVEKLKQINLFLQTQAVCQEKLEQLRERQHASIISQMELRIKDLESELSTMKGQVDSNKIEMENYKQLYQEEAKIRKLLSNKLSKTDERLMEIKTKLLLEKHQNRSLKHSTLNTRPVLGATCIGNLTNRLFIPRSFSRNFPGENLVVPTSDSQPSAETM